MDVKILISILAAVALILIVWRFSSGRYGELRPSQEVTDAFQTFRIAPEKNYFISGSDICPNAIITIDKSRTLESDLWKKIDLTSDEMKKLVGNMRSRAMDQFLQGFDILDDRGAKIGEWFSLAGINVTIWIKGIDGVSISTPPSDIYPGW